MTKESWKSRLGFILAAAGSAIGLANIWRFPYMVGTYGGAAFIAVYLFFLFVIGLPVFFSEVLIGRSSQMGPVKAFTNLLTKDSKVEKSQKSWSIIGIIILSTGFIVSSFYSAIAGWILGYLFEACAGNLSSFTTPQEAHEHFTSLTTSPVWGVCFHALFTISCIAILVGGVKKGIERSAKVLMPLLYIILLSLVVKGLTMPGASKGLHFLLTFNWEALTPEAILVGLGQALFTLSIGQGTMITYGSYLSKKENLFTTCVPVVFMDTIVSLFAAVAVMTIVFSVGMEPDSGPGLLFNTLPLVFSQIQGGYFFAILFFLLVFVAAITSEISAMEPTIAYLVGERGWPRYQAVATCGTGVLILGVPCALSFSILKDFTFFGGTFFDSLNFLTTEILFPFGGFVAVIFVGWIWKKENKEGKFESILNNISDNWIISTYLKICIRYLAPLLIIFVFLNAMGFFL